MQAIGEKVKIIFFDIDETLAVKDTDYMPESVNYAVQQLTERGVKVAIASGRAMYGIKQYIHDLGFETYVLINGQFVSHLGDKLYDNPLEVAEIEATIHWCKQQGLAYGFAGAQACALSEVNEFTQACINHVYGDMQIDEDFYKHQPVYQMWTFGEGDVEKQAPSYLTEKLKFVRWHEYSCDVLSKEGSKANGIAQVLAAFNLDATAALAFGDGLNDIEMFQHVGYAVAMGNAHPELIPYADDVTAHIEDDGIYHALVKLGLIPPRTL